MSERAIRPEPAPGNEAGPARATAVTTLPLDSAISHCEKLRRVLELEEWINGARDDALLVGTCRTWQLEREQLLFELQLS